MLAVWIHHPYIFPRCLYGFVYKEYMKGWGRKYVPKTKRIKIMDMNLCMEMSNNFVHMVKV
jgi:hypothetical protein